jgi:hypothetical protein
MHAHPCLNSAAAHARAVVAFSPTVGAALHNALIGVVGSILGAGLGILIIALVAALASSFSYADHPVEMVGPFSWVVGGNKACRMHAAVLHAAVHAAHATELLYLLVLVSP